MERIVVSPGEDVSAAAEGQQGFVGGGRGSVVRLNGNPADYTCEWRAAAAPDAGDGFALIARNGSGEYRIAATIERIRFVGGAFCHVRNLPAVIGAGDRHAARTGIRPAFTSHAQIREDVLLMRALRDVPASEGFYIDVGAYDPDADSVTRTFYERGWRGINLEPSAAHHAKLARRRPRDTNLCVAASNARGTLHFFHNDGEQLGTLEQRFAPADAAGVAVPVVRLDEICRDHAPGEIHFLKIDVEGHERNVLEGCDFARFRPWIVVMEAVAPNRADLATFGEWEDILLDAGYRLAGEDELNRYYLAEERAALMPAFAVPVDNYVTAADMAEHARLTALVEQLGTRIATLEQAAADRGGGLLGWLRRRA